MHSSTLALSRRTLAPDGQKESPARLQTLSLPTAGLEDPHISAGEAEAQAQWNCTTPQRATQHSTLQGTIQASQILQDYYSQ